MDTLFHTVAIVGPGLIGGSMGLALRHRGLSERVIGIGRRPTSLDQALEAGALDEATLDLEEGVAPADLVVIATPISAFRSLAPPIASAMKAGALLTDVASTKQQIIDTVAESLRNTNDLTYIPTHPMAGSEKRGPRNARETLFEGSICIFTPLPDTPLQPLEALTAMWKALGATVRCISPAAHDRLVACISHLPHLAATALIRTVSSEQGELAGGGLIDTTRVASGDPRLWRDICSSNTEEIDRALGKFISELEKLRKTLRDEDFEQLQESLDSAKQRRDALVAERRNRRDNNSTQ